ncbi:RT_RNaseH_2 domain-containing protein [Nephila pilipes]|uniref:RT_RNaseH_2 domain-containing protein n=1 Tax=Nephila pilipes TaxID=299642 RepID=A0A8X6UV95_NEPPI|nr:RT_RNaseH_2 domain-containing protein [Nephila pilipes]
MPDTIHELRTFLGMINFYRRYLKNAAKTQAPLHDLLKKAKKKDRRKVPWTETTIKNFEQCKSDLAKAALLSFPKSGLPLSLCVDASHFAIGSVLQQERDNQIHLKPNVKSLDHEIPYYDLKDAPRYDRFRRCEVKFSVQKPKVQGTN